MGMDSFFLQKKDTLNLDRQVSTLLTVFQSLHYSYHIWSSDNCYCSISINEESTNKGLVLHIYGTPNPLVEGEYDWIAPNLEPTLLFEDITLREDMVLNVLSNYIQKYPDGVFYNEMEWFYTKEDIERIQCKAAQDWCYLKPED